MKNNLVFYYNPMSRGRIVHWMLEEVGAAYEVKLLDWKKAEHKSADYLKINPMGKIPALVHNEVVITETPAICMYLADAFPEKGLAPALNDKLRGTYLRWFFFTVACLESAMMDIKSPRAQSVSPSHLGYGTYDDTLNTIEKVISTGYALGNKFSALDVYLSMVIDWGLQNNQIPVKASFQNYVNLCKDRPAFKKFTDLAAKL